MNNLDCISLLGFMSSRRSGGSLGLSQRKQASQLETPLIPNASPRLGLGRRGGRGR